MVKMNLFNSTDQNRILKHNIIVVKKRNRESTDIVVTILLHITYGKKKKTDKVFRDINAEICFKFNFFLGG